MSRFLHFGIGCAYPSHADVLTDGIVKQVIVLRDKRHLIVKLAERYLTKIVSAHRYLSVLHVPESRNQLGKSGFPGARRTDKRRHTVLRNRKGDIVQDLFVIVVAERDAADFNAVICKFNALRAVLLFLGFQYFIDLGNGCADQRKRIHEVERRHDRRRHPERENDNGHKCFGCECAVRVEQPAEGKYCEHLRREEGVSHGHSELTAAHPIIVILRVCANLVRELGVGGFALIERFDDLDAVYVLDHGGAHFGRRPDCTFVVLGVAAMTVIIKKNAIGNTASDRSASLQSRINR